MPSALPSCKSNIPLESLHALTPLESLHALTSLEELGAFDYLGSSVPTKMLLPPQELTGELLPEPDKFASQFAGPFQLKRRMKISTQAQAEDHQPLERLKDHQSLEHSSESEFKSSKVCFTPEFEDGCRVLLKWFLELLINQQNLGFRNKPCRMVM